MNFTIHAKGEPGARFVAVILVGTDPLTGDRYVEIQPAKKIPVNDLRLAARHSKDLLEQLALDEMLR